MRLATFVVVVCSCLELSLARSSHMFVASSQTGNRRVVKRHVWQQQQKPKSADDEVQISALKVTSNIQFRYSRTVVIARVKNGGNEANELQFRTLIPDSAFISNFSMVLEGVEYVAKVKDKAEAKDSYDAAVGQGQGAGLVQQDVRNANVFTVSANVEAGSKVEFILTYDELLQRTLGQYEQVINVSPGQIVKDFEVVININESLPLTKLEERMRESTNDIESKGKETSIGNVERDLDGNPNNARVTFNLGKKYQLQFGQSGFSGDIVVTYDVDRKNQSSEVQVIDGYFVHFFAPEELKTLPKNVIFVLDNSGSMFGEKLTQLKDAMFTILNDLTENDYYNIVLFSSFVKRWNGGQKSVKEYQPLKATQENKNLGIDYIVGLRDEGSTNINEALLEALKLAKETKKSVPENVQTMIVFLTDGQATMGITHSPHIKDNVKRANIGKTPIFGIAFGRDADFDLLKDISKDTDSFAKQIYEGSDAALQLEDFFALISSPLISNLKFNYVGELVEQDSLTENQLTTFFDGGEFIVAGKLSDENSTTSIINVTIQGSGLDNYYKKFSICLRPEIPVPVPDALTDEAVISIVPEFPTCLLVLQRQRRSDAQNFLQNLYTFLNIKQLIKKDNIQSRDTAKKLALENNFVTPLTSLLVCKPNNTDELGSLEPPRTSYGHPMFMSGGNQMIMKSYAMPGPGITFSRYSGAPVPDITIVADSLNFSGGGRRRGMPTTTTTSQPPHHSATSYISYSTPNVVADSLNSGGGTRRGRPTTNSRPDNPPPFSTIHDPMDRDQVDFSNNKQNKPPCEGNITIFSKTYLRGEEFKFNDSAPDMFNEGGNAAVSVKIEGTCCWQFFGSTNYQGSTDHQGKGIHLGSGNNQGSRGYHRSRDSQGQDDPIRLQAGREYNSVTSLGQLRSKVKSIKKVNCSLFDV